MQNKLEFFCVFFFAVLPSLMGRWNEINRNTIIVHFTSAQDLIYFKPPKNYLFIWPTHRRFRWPRFFTIFSFLNPYPICQRTFVFQRRCKNTLFFDMFSTFIIFFSLKKVMFLFYNTLKKPDSFLSQVFRFYYLFISLIIRMKNQIAWPALSFKIGYRLITLFAWWLAWATKFIVICPLAYHFFFL